MPDGAASSQFWINDSATKRQEDFGEYFQIGCTPEPADPLVARRVDEINDEMRRLDGRDLPADVLSRERAAAVRRDYAGKLRSVAQAMMEAIERQEPWTDASREDLVRRLAAARGEYDFRTGQLLSAGDIASLSPPDNPTKLVLGQLPAGATPEQQSLLLAIARTLTVVTVVFDQREWARAGGRWGGLAAGPSTASLAVLQNVRADYIRELKSIADEGFASSGGAKYAALRLEAFKDAFVAREAEAVKNQYVKKLGVRAAGFALGFLLIWALLGGFGVTSTLLDVGTLRNFLLLFAAAATGTWLSFSLRRVNLQFGDLATLEEDRLNPLGRLVFVTLLTGVLALLIHEGLITFEIGGTPISAATPLMALLLGVLCGIAERSLSSTISRRAEDALGAGAGQRGAAEPAK